MPKIAKIEITSLEYILEAGKGYGNARGVNNRRNCSLIKVTTDEGVTGLGDAAGPLGRRSLLGPGEWLRSRILAHVPPAAEALGPGRRAARPRGRLPRA